MCDFILLSLVAQVQTGELYVVSEGQWARYVLGN